MASLLLSEAAKLSNDEVVEGIVEDIITEDMWFQYLPFVQINGLSHVFKREKSLGNTDWAGIGQDLSGDEYRGGATFETVNVGLATTALQPVPATILFVKVVLPPPISLTS